MLIDVFNLNPLSLESHKFKEKILIDADGEYIISNYNEVGIIMVNAYVNGINLNDLEDDEAAQWKKIAVAAGLDKYVERSIPKYLLAYGAVGASMMVMIGFIIMPFMVLSEIIYFLSYKLLRERKIKTFSNEHLKYLENTFHESSKVLNDIELYSDINSKDFSENLGMIRAQGKTLGMAEQTLKLLACKKGAKGIIGYKSYIKSDTSGSVSTSVLTKNVSGGTHTEHTYFVSGDAVK